MSKSFAEVIANKKRPIHLFGHFGRRLSVVIGVCGQPFNDIFDINARVVFLNAKAVTCKKCLFYVKNDKELDPITRRYEPEHSSCPNTSLISYLNEKFGKKQIVPPGNYSGTLTNLKPDGEGHLVATFKVGDKKKTKLKMRL